RQQIKSLRYTQQKEIEDLRTKLTTWKCQSCKESEQVIRCEEADSESGAGVLFTPIGILSTTFPKKRGVPRQPGICHQSHGKLSLFNTIFTNPEHALEGLSEFSHMWILFHFDRNDSLRLHAKVSPPRLNGERTGVFATRSPHRPCPIGLSLVHIDSIRGSTIYFSGVDMLDGTPVFDIKPYIPQYDDPMQQIEDIEDKLEIRDLPIAPGSPGVCPGYREAPDGEDSDEDFPATLHSVSENVRVPSWVKKSGSHMSVNFTQEAEGQLQQLDKIHLEPVIKSVLREDPRSVYLKQRYSNQFYTFLISDLHVSCKFNDAVQSVNVYRISQAGKLCECGEQEWQCSNHGVFKS
ncbi:hypothetical protein AAG570_008136, partial [Ranatra chinensis]